MQRMFLASVTIALAAVSAAVVVPAQGQQPTFATTKVTDNVYYFRYQGHQSMFIVTPAGVIATDPISENRPAAEAYLAEIRKITQAPIRYWCTATKTPITLPAASRSRMPARPSWRIASRRGTSRI